MLRNPTMANIDATRQIQTYLFKKYSNGFCLVLFHFLN